jgi:alkanesulfonate monooxygenase SsuD/methylene tetrahydromethanopterin reductase-like flavin-dependent oxidoreductase (luciferase family)
MHYGIDLPHFGPYADARVLAELARDAEAAGWEGFFNWDHISWGMSGTPMVDPWVALTAVAMSTEHIRLGALVTPLPRRRPTKIARETVSLDRLSGGRLVFGVGIGEGHAEWEDLGDEGDPKIRGDMLDEGLDLLVRLWSGEPVNHEGTHYTVKNSIYVPTPVQQPRIPIWVAGVWPNKRPFRRAARWDGIYPLKQGFEQGVALTPEDVVAIVSFIRQHRSTEDPFDVVQVGTTSGDDTTRDSEKLMPFVEAGVTWWLEDITPWSMPNWEEGEQWPLEAMRDRIRKGPPKVLTPSRDS